METDYDWRLKSYSCWPICLIHIFFGNIWQGFLQFCNNHLGGLDGDGALWKMPVWPTLLAHELSCQEMEGGRGTALLNKSWWWCWWWRGGGHSILRRWDDGGRIRSSCQGSNDGGGRWLLSAFFYFVPQDISDQWGVSSYHCITPTDLHLGLSQS